jgi:hypothetical protein
VLATRHDRRELLKWGAAALAALAAACAPAAPPTATPAPARPTEATAPAPTGKPGPVGTPVPRPTETSKAVEPTSPAAAAAQPAATEPAEAAKATAGGETVYVFNVGSKDVTLIDAASFKPLQTRPLGAQVRWLSNEQSYWDGQRIWTYDYPDNKLQAIAIDPREIAVTKTIAGLGTGPAHSLVVLPDGKKAAVNVAGDNLIAFLDLTSGQVDGTMTTGAFP